MSQLGAPDEGTAQKLRASRCEALGPGRATCASLRARVRSRTRARSYPRAPLRPRALSRQRAPPRPHAHSSCVHRVFLLRDCALCFPRVHPHAARANGPRRPRAACGQRTFPETAPEEQASEERARQRVGGVAGPGDPCRIWRATLRLRSHRMEGCSASKQPIHTVARSENSGCGEAPRSGACASAAPLCQACLAHRKPLRRTHQPGTSTRNPW